MRAVFVLFWLPDAAALAVSGGPYFLGIDLSTQSCTGVILDRSLRQCGSHSVNFDAELPSYGTTAGMNVRDGGVVTSPVDMWLAAMDKLLRGLEPTNLLGEVACVSCSGQQHGSVYWTGAGVEALRSPDAAAKGFDDALDLSAFALRDCPIWADSSTQEICDAIEASLGGGAAVAALTGSRAYTRFTGVQMAAVAQRHPEAWAKTEHVSLVSSFATSLFLGATAPHALPPSKVPSSKVPTRHHLLSHPHPDPKRAQPAATGSHAGDLAPMDQADASGTLLMDLASRRWSEAVLAASPLQHGLTERIGPAPLPSYTLLGPLSRLAAESYGLPPSCAVAQARATPCEREEHAFTPPALLRRRPGARHTMRLPRESVHSTPPALPLRRAGVGRQPLRPRRARSRTRGGRRPLTRHVRHPARRGGRGRRHAGPRRKREPRHATDARPTRDRHCDCRRATDAWPPRGRLR